MTLLDAKPQPSSVRDPFVNEPVLELRRASVRGRLSDALAALDRELPLGVPVIVGADTRTGSGEEFDSTDPGDPDRVVARATTARAADVTAAVAAAREGFHSWSRRRAAERALALTRTAAWLRERRVELAALEVRECAKPWPEADADVCEAIDFIEYYARGAIELEAGPPLIQIAGERNEMGYFPRGVTAVISPGTFPWPSPAA